MKFLLAFLLVVSVAVAAEEFVTPDGWVIKSIQLERAAPDSVVPDEPIVVVPPPVVVVPPPVVVVPPPVVVVPPDALFLDLVQAPAGAPVSVYGRVTGASMTVGDTTLTDCPIQNETVYHVTDEGVDIRLAKTTCWLWVDMPPGMTTVNGLPFEIIDGRVITITNASDFAAAMTAKSDEDGTPNPRPGDVYVLRDFEVGYKVNGGNSVLWMRGGEHDGDIALVGYPGEPATIRRASKYDVNFNNAMRLSNSGWSIVNLNIESRWMAAAFGTSQRIVGNRFKGLQDFPKQGSGTGTVVLQGNRGGHFIGNTVSGGRSAWRFDHAVYPSGCPRGIGWNISHNYIHDNAWGRGPQISINHQPNRCGVPVNGYAPKILGQHTVANNIIDSSRMPGKCIGQNSVGHHNKVSPPGQAPTIIRDNVLIDCGFIDPPGTPLTEKARDHYGDFRFGNAINIARGATVQTNNLLIRSAQ